MTPELLLTRIATMRVPKPVPWFLDIDGVINLFRARGADWPSYQQAYIEDNRNGVERFFTWSPDLVEVINAMVAQGLVQVRWLSTWEYEAVSNVAPSLGLEVGEWVAGIDGGDEASWWKMRVIREHLLDAGDFFIWTDDHIARRALLLQQAALLTPEHGVVISPEMDHGLTPAHIVTILDGIENHYR